MGNACKDPCPGDNREVSFYVDSGTDPLDPLPTHQFGKGSPLISRKLCSPHIDSKQTHPAATKSSNSTMNEELKSETIITQSKSYRSGRYEFSNGDAYEGDLENEVPQGRGTFLHNESGARYEGEWHNQQMHGHGVETWPNGMRYSGQYKNGKKTGKGVFRFADGEQYDGQWLDNQMHGFGKYIWPDGSLYEGEWIENKKHGRGVYVYANANGSRYEGEFRDDEKCGQGKYTDAKTGTVYEGSWKHNKRHGRGVEKRDGTQRVGIWEADKEILECEEDSQQ